jgi:peptidyl-prolyl cis-trans isomerase A (cyclophilin A)
MSLQLLALAMLMIQQPAVAPKTAQPMTPIVVVLETELGNITLELDSVHAPITVANFLRYVDGGFYDGGDFCRSVRPDNEVRKDAPIQVIQFRINEARRNEEFSPIPVERTSATGLAHVDATVSMARDVTPTRSGPVTATNDVFITIGNQPNLDDTGNRSPDGQGFAAFGKVIAGMDVVEKIHASPTPKGLPATPRAGPGQTLVPAVRIVRAYRK